MNDHRPARLVPYPTPGPASRGPREPASQDWEIGIYGDLSDKQPELISRMLEVPRGSRGTIFFDSCGGSVYVGLGLASLIRMRGLQADGVVAGECSSAALLPFAACQRRFVTAHSTLLFHPVRWSSDEEVRFEEAVEWARHFKLLEEDLDSLLSRMFNCSRELLTKWSRPGRFVSGTEVVEAGLAHMVDLFAGDVWSQISEAVGDQ